MTPSTPSTPGKRARDIGGLSAALTRKIKGLRAEHGLSQEAMASRAGIPYPTYRKLENGTSVIDVEQQSRIARALEVDPDDLYEMALIQAREDAIRDTAGDDSDEAKLERLRWVPIGELTAVERAFVLAMLSGRGDYMLAANEQRADETSADGDDEAAEEGGSA